MDAEPLVEVSGVKKKYCHSLRSSMKYGLKDVYSDLAGRQTSPALRADEFYALEGIDLTLNRGECLGLVGPNGAGKSTLLKMINGIFMPDEGSIRVRGKVGALIEVGAGFHPLLSGRENIYLNGSILGMSRRYIDSCFDSIVEFAELEQFIDMPVKNYSSGMYVRLGFSIASKLKADVILLDEILSVGDVRFQAKCFNAINELMRDSAVVFVSHAMAQISRVSTKVACLNGGRLQLFDDPAAGIESFLQSQAIAREPLVTGSQRVQISNFAILDSDGRETTTLRYDQAARIVMSISASEEISSCMAVVSFWSSDSTLVAQCSSLLDGEDLSLRGGRSQISLSLDRLMLNVGVYSITVGIMDAMHGEVFVRVDNIHSVAVKGEFCGYAPVQFSGDWSVS